MSDLEQEVGVSPQPAGPERIGIIERNTERDCRIANRLSGEPSMAAALLGGALRFDGLRSTRHHSAPGHHVRAPNVLSVAVDRPAADIPR